MKEAAQRIKDKTGVARSRFQVSRYLKQIGLSRLKVGQIPDKGRIAADVKMPKLLGTDFADLLLDPKDH